MPSKVPYLFVHQGILLAVRAFPIAEGWELRVVAKDEAALCHWKVDPALLRDDPIKNMPQVMAMLAALIVDGIIPIDLDLVGEPD